MKIAIYPGSFNPWHNGHQDVLDKALKVFDMVYLSMGINPGKDYDATVFPKDLNTKYQGKIVFDFYNNLLADHVKSLPVCAIIKGIRNVQDLEYETAQQYWNEDLGIELPTFYVITDRKLRHISSSALRQLEKFK